MAEGETGSAGRRLSIITIDQGISGASNLLIAVIAARSLTVAGFGLFGIVLLIYVAAQGAARAMVGEPLLVHPVEIRARTGDAIGSAALVGLAFGAVVCALGAFAAIWNAPLGLALVITGVALPLIGLEDFGRYLGFATQRPRFSLGLDLFWLAAMVVALALILPAHPRSLAWFTAAWAGSGAAAGLLVVWRHRAASIRLSFDWLRATWTFSWRYLLSFVATQIAGLLTAAGVVAIAGVKALGAVRGALLMLRPIVMFQAASMAAGVAETARLGDADAAIRRHTIRTSALTTIWAALNLLVLVAIPDRLGHAVLGDTWEPTQPLLLPAALQMLLYAAISGPRSTLLGLRAVRTTVRIDVAGAAGLLAATLIGALINGALGAYWALVAGQGVMLVVWWLAYLRTLRPDGQRRVHAEGVVAGQ